MRSRLAVLVPCSLVALAIACGSDDDDGSKVEDEPGNPAGAAGQAGSNGTGVSGSGGSPGGGDGGTSAGGAGGGAAGTGGTGPTDIGGGGEVCERPLPKTTTSGQRFAAATRLVPGAATPLGVTADEQIIYRLGTVTYGVDMTAGATSSVVTDAPGLLTIKGRVVFSWSNVDYTKGLGNLSVWSANDCRRSIGSTLLNENYVAASSDGAYVLYATNVTETTINLVAAKSDLSERHQLIAGIGLASESTCAPQYGFAGNRVVVGWCSPGSRDAKLDVFERGTAGWTSTRISETANGGWSTDATGSQIVYTTSGSQARRWAGTDQGDIDEGVSWSVFTPDASALLYVVGDQLRRTTIPDVVSIPIVTNKFRHLNGFSPNRQYALYSTVIDYDAGERRDLLLTSTETFNPTPLRIVPTAAARLTKSVFTADSQHLLYLTDGTTADTNLLHVRPVAGATERTFENVQVARAGSGDLVLFTNNRSAAGVYPVVSDLNVVSATAGAPALLRAKVSATDAFYVAPDGGVVVYGSSGGTDEGLWVHPLPAPAPVAP